MKKEYISPIADMVLMETDQMIATSILGSDPGNNFNVEFSKDDYEGEAASRRNAWADESFDSEEF